MKRWLTLVFILSAMLLIGACKKKVAPPPPPPPPAPSAPTASLSANPNTVDKGQATTLTWQTTNATDVSIDGIGPVEMSGSRSVTPTASLTDQQLFAQNVKDILFDYDKGDIRPDQQASVQGDAQFLQAHPNIHITIEGHCDERGSTEYNLALGTNRADAVKNALIQSGVGGDRIKTISYGKEKPFCTESNESCWQQNRVGHFVYEQ
jgi:peptidoglycan-associated lipoprotein